MRISRRSLLKGAAAAGATVALTGTAEAAHEKKERPDAVGMLYDSTLCIGCRASARPVTAAAVPAATAPFSSPRREMRMGYSFPFPSRSSDAAVSFRVAM